MDSFGKLEIRLMVLAETIFDSFSFGMLHSNERMDEFGLECDSPTLGS